RCRAVRASEPSQAAPRYDGAGPQPPPARVTQGGADATDHAQPGPAAAAPRRKLAHAARRDRPGLRNRASALPTVQPVQKRVEYHGPAPAWAVLDQLRHLRA